MFATGMFSMDDVITTSQRYHDKTNPWDDNPTHNEMNNMMQFDDDPDWHGYVSNVGEVVTIHILKDYYDERYISEVKRVFFLMLETGIKEIRVEEWNND